MDALPGVFADRIVRLGPNPKHKPERKGLDQSRTLNSHSPHPPPQTFLPVPGYTCSSKSVYNLSIGKEKYYN